MLYHNFSLYSNSYSKFIKYSNLNEISKFINFKNLFLLSNIERIRVWFRIDLSQEKSRLLGHSKVLLGAFLIYLVTCKYPNIISSKDKRIFQIEVNLKTVDLRNFLEKLLIVTDCNQRKNVVKTFKIQGNLVRLVVTDFNLFLELRSSINLFSLVEWLFIDIICTHEEDYRNRLFLDNLFKSSYLV